MAGLSLYVLNIILILYTGGATAYDVTNAQLLFTNLTTGYNILLRPSEPVSVNVEFSVLSVNALDVKQQLFSITGYITATWNDTRLSWIPTDYGSIAFMFLTEDYVWKPELVIQNSAINIPIVDNDNLSMKVEASGVITWDPPGIYIVNCDVDITYYPFDTQTCYVTISTWSHDSVQIMLLHSKSSINLEDFQENGEWTMVNSYVVSSTRADRNDEDISRAALLFYFVMERKVGYYILNVILPPMLTSFLGLMVFLLPAESGEKVGFCITVLLALAVLLTITTDYIPSTSKNTSLYGVYLLCSLFLSAIEVVVTTFVLRLHHSADRKEPVSPRWQRFANIILARITCNKRCCQNTDGEQQAKQIPLPKRSQISPKSSALTINGSKRDPMASTANSISDIQYEQTTPTPSGYWREYSWQEIAVMVDKMAFFVMLTAWAVISVIFTVMLANN